MRAARRLKVSQNGAIQEKVARLPAAEILALLRQISLLRRLEFRRPAKRTGAVLVLYPRGHWRLEIVVHKISREPFCERPCRYVVHLQRHDPIEILVDGCTAGVDAGGC